MKKVISVILIVLISSFLVSCNAPDQNAPADETAAPTSIVEAADSPTPATPGQTATSEPAQPTETATPTLGPVSVKIELVDAYPGLSFERPLYFTTADDGSGDCYVVEQTGKILVFEDNPSVETAETFLDLSSIVNKQENEQGLLGLAFHPDYMNNGYFYVNYTDKTGTVIARYTRSAGNSRQADPGSGEIILTFKQPYANHNGGHLDFGPDGYLSIDVGDGGSGGDPKKNAQNPATLLGSILRIDVDSPLGDKLYSIPSDNPFAGNNEGYAEEIYAYGLRNPWRFSFDGEGRLWAADVGQNKIEELDIIENGGNYGWNVMEGTLEYENDPDVNKEELLPPIFEYEHDDSDCITGGYVCTGQGIPDLQERYIYGDFGSGKIWALWFDEEGQVINEELLDTNLLISSFGLVAGGDIRIVDLKGKIYKLSVTE